MINRVFGQKTISIFIKDRCNKDIFRLDLFDNRENRMTRDIDIEKLRGGENYHTWKFAMQNVLTLKGFSKCIIKGADGTLAEKDENKLQACKATLCLGVQSQLYVHIQSLTTAFDIWEKFKTMYEDKGLCSRIGILRNFISIRLETSDGMQHYVDQLLGQSSKLRGIGFDISEDWMVAIILAGLTDEFKPLIMGLEATNQEMSSEMVITKLLDNQQADKSGEALL